MDGIQKEIITKSSIPEDTEELLGAAEALQTMLMMYSCAIREFKTKVEVLNDELSIRGQRNPIEFIKTRVGLSATRRTSPHERYGKPLDVRTAGFVAYGIVTIAVKPVVHRPQRAGIVSKLRKRHRRQKILSE